MWSQTIEHHKQLHIHYKFMLKPNTKWKSERENIQFVQRTIGMSWFVEFLNSSYVICIWLREEEGKKMNANKYTWFNNSPIEIWKIICGDSKRKKKSNWKWIRIELCSCWHQRERFHYSVSLTMNRKHCAASRAISPIFRLNHKHIAISLFKPHGICSVIVFCTSRFHYYRVLIQKAICASVFVCDIDRMVDVLSVCWPIGSFSILAQTRGS